MKFSIKQEGKLAGIGDSLNKPSSTSHSVRATFYKERFSSRSERESGLFWDVGKKQRTLPQVLKLNRFTICQKSRDFAELLVS